MSVTGENFKFTSGATNGYYTITNSEFTDIATIKVSNKTGSRVKIANGSDFTIEAADNKTITKITNNLDKTSKMLLKIMGISILVVLGLVVIYDLVALSLGKETFDLTAAIFG